MANRDDLPAPTEGLVLTHVTTVRHVAAARRCYVGATAEGAQFLTGRPLDRTAELRCHLRDPGGYLIEVGQATGILEGILADLPAGSAR